MTTKSVAVESYREEGEHPCEPLIRIIQSREGNPSQKEREDAFIKLLDMFRLLICKINNNIWNKWKRSIFQDADTFYHDTVTDFTELVLSDYIPKKYGGAAMFGPYIQNKLYWSTYHRAEALTKTYTKESSTQAFTSIHREEFNRGRAGIRSGISFLDNDESAEIRAAVYHYILGNPTEVEDNFNQQQLRIRLQILVDIAQKSLDERDFYIWSSMIFSERTTVDLAAELNTTRKVVYSAYKKARTNVLTAYGKFALAGE